MLNFITSLTMLKFLSLWSMMSCRLVYKYQRFGRARCYHLQSRLFLDNPEYGSSKLLRNRGSYGPMYTAPYRRKRISVPL
jgi:hypothetical protein